MNQRAAPAIGVVGGKQQRRGMTLLWIAIAATIVVTLLVTEQVAMLYVLATLSVTALLAVVAVSDLGDARKMTGPASFDDAAAISDRTSATGTTQSASTPPRTTTTANTTSRRQNR